jgi:hypothetical protein
MGSYNWQQVTYEADENIGDLDNNVCSGSQCVLKVIPFSTAPSETVPFLGLLTSIPRAVHRLETLAPISRPTTMFAPSMELSPSPGITN